tara:strand:+ start:30533 stop:30952 length:420 start_codon:yes stop_codon:yes gene_type:complete
MSETKRDLYNSVKWQNEMIDVENARLRDKYSTDLQRVKHMHQNIMGWNVFNFYLWWIFYIIVGVVIYLIIKEKIIVSPKHKWYLIGCLVVYPFLISTLEVIIYNLYQFLISVINGVPYPKYSSKPKTDSVFNTLPAFYY